VIASIPTGDESDGLAYDPKAKVAVTSNGEGNMSFVAKRGGKYVLLENVPTKKGARTIAFDGANWRVSDRKRRLQPGSQTECRQSAWATCAATEFVRSYCSGQEKVSIATRGFPSKH
jgi:hypothetical protein